MADKKLINALRNVLNDKDNRELKEFIYYVFVENSEVEDPVEINADDPIFLEGVYNELYEMQKYGSETPCAGLIYYDDLVRFYDHFRERINECIYDSIRSFDLKQVVEWLEIDIRDALALNKYAKSAYAYDYAKKIAREIVTKVEQYVDKE